jgi:hypothetical protein
LDPSSLALAVAPVDKIGMRNNVNSHESRLLVSNSEHIGQPEQAVCGVGEVVEERF